MSSHLTKRDYEYFDMARKIAQESTFDNFHLGAVIVYKGRVISTGCNSHKSHPMQKKYNKKYRHFNRSSKMINDSIHAEMSCLVNIPKCVDLNLDYSKCKVYIYRISPGKRLQVGLARPCEACMNALRDKGIRKIYYTTDGGFAMEELY